MTRPTVIDFETQAISARPAYPPAPVGVAIDEPGQRPVYLAVGHPTDNNATWEELRSRLQTIWRGGAQILMHNAKFDLDVAETHLGLPMLSWHRIEDTLLLAFLAEPHAATLALKPLAERLANIQPVARDALQTWVLANVPDARRSPRTWGAYIALAPGSLVGRYAIADVTMTRRLYAVLRLRALDSTRMREAYDRERRLLPCLLRMERGGIPLATQRLTRDLESWAQSLEAINAWIRHRLRAPNLDIDKPQDLADALENAGLVTEWAMTPVSRNHPAGQRSVAGPALAESLHDAAMLGVLRYRALLNNGARTFASPWLATARTVEKRDHIYTSWNQTRRTSADGSSLGARTGRLSSTPNLQNVPCAPPIISWTPNTKVEGYLALPSALHNKVTALPNLRNYIIAPPGYRMNDRDYSQQELRLLGHFEGATLREAYANDPRLDVHKLAQTLINKRLSMDLPRRIVKNLAFGLIYGMGAARLAVELGCPVAEAQVLQSAYLEILPGVLQLTRELKNRAIHDEPITTWGGRRYHVEPSRIINGRLRTFAYKLLNVLIQGSAADVIKEAIVRYCETCHEDARMILTVHDELVTLAPTALARQDMDTLRTAMESIECTVPLLTTGSASGTSWARLKAVKN